MCVSKQTAFVSLYRIKWHIVVFQTECVYSTVQTDYLKIIKFKFSLQSVKFFYIEFFLYLQRIENQHTIFFRKVWNLLPSDATS